MPDADVIVIGGGPAGSATATMLARKGWRVVLFERERFPRTHVGESLLPASMPILDELGVLADVRAAGFLEKWGATMLWGTSGEPWSWYFRETNPRNPHAYQVWRPTFDHLLLKNAAGSGVTVHEQHRVLEVLWEGDRATGVHVAAADGTERRLSAEMIVDASGQTGLLGRTLDLRRNDESFRNLAIWGYYKGGEHLEPPDQGNIFIEAYSDGWAWTIPLQGMASVGFVVDSAYGQQGIREQGRRAFFLDQLARTERTRHMQRQAELLDDPEVIRDWSYRSERITGPGWVLAGDAACFIDPLFSSGVHLALSSGMLAAAHVTTALRHPEMAEATGAVYQELYYQQYDHFRELARLFYASNRTAEGYFWEARRIVDGPDSEPARHSFIRAVAGQPPQGYERAVLGHGALPEAFTRGIEDVESERSRRRLQAEAAALGPDPGRTPLVRAVPILAPGAAVERKPVLGDGEFEWGYALTRPDAAEVPLSGLIAVVVSLIDGQRPVSDIVATLVQRVGEEQASAVVPAVLSAIQILYVDGAITELRGI